MNYVSLFSGIEAATVAWRDLGWNALAFAEVDPFPSAVLAHRFPDVPNLGDVREIDWKEFVSKHGAVDVIVGGSPCQSFSIAGGRASLDGESRLMFEYIRAVGEVRPTWFLWENVPGVLSTRDNAFEQLLSEMEELGYGMAWRTLDAQFFGVAQRRRRVFLVGCLGNVGASAAVLFESESVSGNTQPSKQKRESLTGAVEERAGSGGFKFHQGASAGSIGYVDEQSPTLTSDWHQPAVLAFAQNTRDEVRIVGGDGSVVGAISAQPGMKQTSYVMCVADDNANAAMDYDMSGSLKVGGGCAVNSAGTDYVNALCARDYKGIGNQDIGDGKLICQFTCSSCDIRVPRT